MRSTHLSSVVSKAQALHHWYRITVAQLPRRFHGEMVKLDQALICSWEEVSEDTVRTVFMVGK